MNDLLDCFDLEIKHDESLPTPQNYPGTNKYFKDPALGIKLLAELVSQGSTSGPQFQQLRALEELKDKDFMDFCQNCETSGSAKAMKELSDSIEDLTHLVFFPELENRLTVGIGGQFSAGKSCFLNSILGTKNLLPVDTSATTSIPTFLLNGNENEIIALNRSKGKVKIDEEGLKAISHEFSKLYGVSFSHILDIITVRRKNIKYDKINFLDTPGYSKAEGPQGAYSNTDKAIAKEHLRSADALIWLIDIQNGTIPAGDLEFLEKMEFPGPILVVLNKADKKPPSEISACTKATRDSLQDTALNIFGVIAYSSQLNKEVGTDRPLLSEFLERLNTEKAGTRIMSHIESTFDRFGNFYKSDISFLRNSRNALNQISLDDTISGEQRIALENSQASIRKRLELLQFHARDLGLLKDRIIQTAEELCRLSGIALLEKRYAVVWETGKKGIVTKDYYFKGKIDSKTLGNTNSLGSLQNITGIITKISSSGVSIVLSCGTKIFIDRLEQKEKIHRLLEGLVSTGTEVRAKILDKFYAEVVIELQL